MEEFFSSYGFSSEAFTYVILPVMIFFARILDVSINTIRIIFVMSGRKGISSILGFFESLIWLLAIGQIFQHMNNVFCYIAYPAGFGMGILVGMWIEEKLAYGKVVLRIISSESVNEVISYFENNNLKHTLMKSGTHTKEESILFSVINRDQLDKVLYEIKSHLPNSFYTVESVKQASEFGHLLEPRRTRNIGSWLGSVKRK